MIPGGSNPDWGPADVPAGRGGTTGGGLKAKAVKAKLGRALKKGFGVKVTVPSAGRVSATATDRGLKVASGSKRVAAGKATVKLRFSRGARAALEQRAQRQAPRQGRLQAGRRGHADHHAGAQAQAVIRSERAARAARRPSRVLPSPWHTVGESTSAVPRSRSSSSATTARSPARRGARRRRKGGPKDVANEIVGALRDAAAARRTSRRRSSTASASARPARSTTAPAPSRARRTCPAGTAATTCGAALEKACGAPVSLGNDVQVATDAEFELGSARDYDSLLGVFWGTGVGGGIVLDGKPWIGRDAAGEIGHVVVRQDGALCGCGRRGCMEAYAGRAVDGGPRAAAPQPRREHGAVQDHGGARPDAADQRRVVARARQGRPAGAAPDRPRGARARHRHRLLAEPARRRGDRDRRRARAAARASRTSSGSATR